MNSWVPLEAAAAGTHVIEVLGDEAGDVCRPIDGETPATIVGVLQVLCAGVLAQRHCRTTRQLQSCMSQ
jgi:hypothetical protein